MPPSHTEPASLHSYIRSFADQAGRMTCAGGSTSLLQKLIKIGKGEKAKDKQQVNRKRKGQITLCLCVFYLLFTCLLYFAVFLFPFFSSCRPAHHYPPSFRIIELKISRSSFASWRKEFRSADISSGHTRSPRLNFVSLASLLDVRNFISLSFFPKASLAST